MGRPAKLVIGILLLLIAGLLLIITSGQTANRNNGLGLSCVFGAPGLLLTTLGLLPGRTVNERIKMTFLSARLLGGLAVSLAAIGALCCDYFLPHVIPNIIKIGALLAIPFGLFFAATCWTESCWGCDTVFREVQAHFNAESSSLLATLIQSNAISQILQLETAAPSAGRICITLRYCPRCRSVGILEGPGQVQQLLHAEQIHVLLCGLRTR